MKESTKYLDKAKSYLQLTSDYQLAQKIGVTRSAISNYRHERSTIDNYTASRLADILDIDPIEIISCANAENERSVDRKKWWENISKKYKNIKVLILSFSITYPFIFDLFNAYSNYYVKSVSLTRLRYFLQYITFLQRNIYISQG